MTMGEIHQDERRHDRPPGEADRRRCQALLNGLDHLMIWEADAQTLQTTFISDSTAKLLGISPESWYAEPAFWPSHLHPDEREAVLDRLRQTVAQGPGAECRFDHRFRQADGCYRWLQTGLRVSRQEGGESELVVLGVAVDMADPTHHKGVEQALRASEARLAGMVESAMDAIISFDKRQRIVLFNAAAERIFGYQASEVIGKSIGHLIPATYRGRHADEIYRFGATGVTSRSLGHPGRVVALRRNGEVFPIEATISQADIGGDKLYTIILRDVTERRQAEEQRSRLIDELQQAVEDNQRSLAQLTAVFENAPVGIALFDRAHRYKGVNTRLATMNGLPGEAHLDRPIAEVAPYEAARVGALIDRIFATGRTFQDLEFTSDPSQAGSPRHWLANFYPVLGPSEEVWLVGAVIVDITDLKQAEANLRRNEKHLRAAKAEAQQAARDREELLSIVSHDLKNPLAAILMNTDYLVRLLPEGEASEQIRRQADSIRAVAERMNRLVVDLLDLSRIQGGQLAIAPSPQPVAPLISDAVHQHEALAAASGIRLQSEVSPDLPAVLADPARLQQVFANLIGNAIRYSKPDGSVTVSAERHDSQIVFAVRDTGPGIPAAQIPLLFERFWQAEATAHRGTGLGLAIAKGIVRAHGGAIWVHSTVGSGSTFFFSLPIAGEGRRPSAA